MAFFDPVPEEQLPPESRRLIEIARKRSAAGPNTFAMAAHPRLLKGFVEVREELNPIPSRFGSGPFIAGMLIAHSVGCRACFNLSRGTLLKVGFDEATLDGYCATPASLPLAERDRRMVEFTLRLACDRGSVKPADFHEMEGAGFSKEDLLEMIGIAAFWNLATTIAIAMDAGLREE
jgi:4-carboxymuconolactone decarboxylase